MLLLWDDVATEALGGRTPQLLGESKAAEILKVIRGLREEVKELARKLEGAKAEGRREAFAEAAAEWHSGVLFLIWLNQKEAGR